MEHEKLVKLITEEVEKHFRKTPEYQAEILTEARAWRLVQTIEEKAKEMGVRTVIAITDSGGNLKLLARSDGAYVGSITIAQEKAYTSFALKMPTAKVGEETRKGGALEGLSGNSYNRISTLGGGEPLIAHGIVVGGVGVSGGTAEEDTYLASYGAQEFIKEGLTW